MKSEHDSAARSVVQRLLRALARGVALFFGLFSLANAAVALRTGRTEDLWWVDLGALPGWVTGILWLTAVLLVAYAIRPGMRPWRRVATVAVSVALMAAALVNVNGFYAASHTGTIVPAVPVPFSAIVAAGFGFVGVVAWCVRVSQPPGRTEVGVVVVVAALLALAFPLAQVHFFGTTDYRRDADVAVVFGARVFANGQLTTSLEDRVRTAADLYTEGRADVLIMSGGVGESGYDEAEVMRDRAIELGVPADVIVLDHQGLDTDHTVANTVATFAPDGSTRVLAVSQFYHLPRIKMAYRAAGQEVYTVPAEESRPIAKTPALVAREIPAFWLYWARAWAR
ncbi:MAG: SanA/YdcF family protein, partial [Coriobacteriia bacterium]